MVAHCDVSCRGLRNHDPEVGQFLEDRGRGYLDDGLVEEVAEVHGWVLVEAVDPDQSEIVLLGGEDDLLVADVDFEVSSILHR